MAAGALLLKPVSGACNLQCRYCFYRDEMANRQTASYGLMDRETMEAVVRKTMEQARGRVSFGFQGGEPALAGLDFFKTFLALERRYNRRGIPVSHMLQTNGLLLDEDWAEFLAENHFLVGLSLDGPREIHDGARRDAAGQGSFSRVMAAAATLRRHRVEFNVLTVVTRKSAAHAQKIYRFFMKQGFFYQQYIPCLGPLGAEAGEYALTPEGYAKFFKALFDVWYEDRRRGKFVYIRDFENLAGMLLGRPPERCGMAGGCRIQWVVEADGSVYPCDFYVLDDYRLGNLREHNFEEIEAAYEASPFPREGEEGREACRSCRWERLCHGGCRRDRQLPRLHDVGKNRYCGAMQEFFEYAVPRLGRLCGL